MDNGGMSRENDLMLGRSFANNDKEKIKNLEEYKDLAIKNSILRRKRFAELLKENKKLKESLELIKALKYAFKDDVDWFRYLKLIEGVCMLPDGDGAYDVNLLDWYRKEVSND